MKLKRNNMIIFLFLLYVCLSAGGLILFKLGSKNAAFHFQSTHFTISLSWIMLLGVVFYALSFILWLLIVSALDLSFAMPLSVGLVNILVFIGSSLVLKESITIMQWVGILVIAFGLFIMNWRG